MLPAWRCHPNRDVLAGVVHRRLVLVGIPDGGVLQLEREAWQAEPWEAWPSEQVPQRSEA